MVFLRLFRWLKLGGILMTNPCRNQSHVLLVVWVTQSVKGIALIHGTEPEAVSLTVTSHMMIFKC